MMYYLSWNVLDSMQNPHRTKTYTGTALRFFTGRPTPRKWAVTLNFSHRTTKGIEDISYNFKPNAPVLVSQLTALVGQHVNDYIYDEVAGLDVVDVHAVARFTV